MGKRKIKEMGVEQIVGPSRLESLLRLHITATKLPAPLTEYKFHPDRDWRFDFCWPAYKLAVEVEGGTFTGGRHTRGTGFEGDCEKYNEAALLGFRVLRFTAAMIEDGRAIGMIQKAVAAIYV